MIYAGGSVELIVDVLPSRDVGLKELYEYHNSSRHRIVRDHRDGGVHPLGDLKPKSLWDFPGHRTIPEVWFREILLYDTRHYDLFVRADIVEFVDSEEVFGNTVTYLAGEYRILAGTRLVVGEPGLVWSFDPNVTLNKVSVAWAMVKSIRAERRIRGRARERRARRIRDVQETPAGSGRVPHVK
ncbi:MAG: hypothetical protein K8I27_11665 [Planctomycetes bacterium]|nr:hypothetical protein [Planctomycetota bacterium]